MRRKDTEMRATIRRLLAAGVVAALFLTACGNDPPEPAPSAAGTREVTDVMGSVEVPARAERIVADSVSTLAHLWALGIVPVGAAVPVGISPEYIGEGVEQVPNLVSDDGWTLDVEQVIAADADLVVATGAGYNRKNCQRYKEAVTTFCFKDRLRSDESIMRMLNDIAAATGREGQADEAIAAYEAKKAELTERVGATDLTDQSVGLVRFDSGGFIGVRVEDTAADLLTELGMRVPDWRGKLIDGYLQLSLENLDTLNAADNLLITLDDDVDPAEVEAFSTPLWGFLEPVANDRAHIVSAWNGSDLPQFMKILDDIERSLVVPAESAQG